MQELKVKGFSPGTAAERLSPKDVMLHNEREQSWDGKWGSRLTPMVPARAASTKTCTRSSRPRRRSARPACAVLLPCRRRLPMLGDHAGRRFLEFFAATIRNKNTRMAYYRAACHFFSWVVNHKNVELDDIEPIDVLALYEG